MPQKIDYFPTARRGAVSNRQLFFILLTVIAVMAGIYVHLTFIGIDPERLAITYIYQHFPRSVSEKVWHWLGRPRMLAEIPHQASKVMGLWALLGTIGIYFAWTKYRVDPSIDRHLSGRQLINVPRRTRRSQLRECRQGGGQGIPLANTSNGTIIPLSLSQETRHLFVVGGIGSGKTNAIRPMIDSARQRGDRCIIYDNKGDFFPGLPDSGDIIYIAPWDARGWRWDVAKDVQTRTDAQSLADTLIQSSEHDPFWSTAARAICVALIVRLQKEKPEVWRFQDLADLVSRGFDEIRDTVAEYTPENILLVDASEGAESENGATGANKTTQSILANLIAGLTTVFQLIDAWDRCQTAGSISIREWLADDNAGRRTLILGGNKAMHSLEKAVFQSILGVVQRQVSSPEMPESDSRRIWLFLDEFPQLGKLPSFGQFLEIGRSKGIRVVLGIQSIPQITDIYGESVMQSWAALVGAWLIGRTGGSDSPEWLSDLIGEREVLRWLPSYSQSRVRAAGAPVPTESHQWQQIRVPVVAPEQFSLLRPGEFYFLPMGADEVHLFRFRQLAKAEKEPKRAHYQPADWTRPGWPESTGKQVAAAVGALSPGQVPNDPRHQQEQVGGEQEDRERKEDERLAVDTTPAHRAQVAVADAGEDLLGDGITRAEVEQVAHALDQVLPGFGALLEGLHLVSEVADEPVHIDEVAVTRTRPQRIEAPDERQRRKRKKRDRDRGREMG